MRPMNGIKLTEALFHVAVSVVGLGTGSVAWAQGQPVPQPPTFPSRTAEVVISSPTLVQPPVTQQPLSQQPPSADYAPQGTAARGPQDGPGVSEYYRFRDEALPNYFYQRPYYNTWGEGARALADYAPSGFEAREWQDAPGAPEFSHLPVPVQTTAEERAKFVTAGMFPGSFLVPGTNTSFRLRGFVRGTGMYDFNPIGSRDDFVTNTIPVPQQEGQNYNFAARYSRFAIESWTPTSIEDWNVHTFIEGDFFNGPAQAVGGGGNPFRLRFAFADFGYFRIGQQNTVFMDSNAWPSTVDFAGPRGLVNQRRPGLRVTLPITDNFYWAGGVEQPFSDITTNGPGAGVQNVPDLATHIRYESDFGHVQVSALGRSIGFQPVDNRTQYENGWGLSGSTVFHPWAILSGVDPVQTENPSGLIRSRILLQYTLGQGIGRYIQDTAGLGLDAQVNPFTGELNTVYARGWSASYEHWFTDKWMTSMTYSEDSVNNTDGQPANTYAGAKYLTAALWYIPVRNTSIGIEYVWGERENLDGEKGKANRVNALFQYNF